MLKHTVLHFKTGFYGIWTVSFLKFKVKFYKTNHDLLQQQRIRTQSGDSGSRTSRAKKIHLGNNIKH